jgi:hypothetical protein
MIFAIQELCSVQLYKLPIFLMIIVSACFILKYDGLNLLGPDQNFLSYIEKYWSILKSRPIVAIYLA